MPPLTEKVHGNLGGRMVRAVEEERRVIEAAYERFKCLYVYRTELFDYSRSLYGGQYVVSGIIRKYSSTPCRGHFRIPPELLSDPGKYDKSDREFEKRNGVARLGVTPEPDRKSEAFYVRETLKNLDQVEPGLRDTQVKHRMVNSEGNRREIDLLCKGTDGRFVVIEFKRRGVNSRQIAAQTIEYMGMLIKQEGEEDCVRGYMLVGRNYPAIEMATLVVKNLHVKLYDDVLLTMRAKRSAKY